MFKNDYEKQQYLKNANIDANFVKLYISKMEHARDTGKVFSLTYDEFKQIMMVERCVYTGKRFDKFTRRTIERINPKLGYEHGNCVAVTKEANTHKSALDSFMHQTAIPEETKLMLLRKATYQIEKKLKTK